MVRWLVAVGVLFSLSALVANSGSVFRSARWSKLAKQFDCWT
jgi:hypothetical protein